MFAAPAFLVVEDNQPRPGIRQVIAAVCPEIGFPGLAAAGVELRHGRFVGM